MKIMFLTLAICFVFIFVIGDEAKQMKPSNLVLPYTKSLAAESCFWNDFRITSEIRDEDLIGTPVWSADGKLGLPLAPEKAVMLAREKLRLYVKGTNTFAVSSMLIRQYMKTNYWFYRIGFVSNSEQGSGALSIIDGWPADQEEFRFFVLMSGRVIVPKIDKIE